MNTLAALPLAVAMLVAAPAVAAPGAPAASAAQPVLAFPLACQIGRTCEIQHYVDRDPGPGTRDYRCGLATYNTHNGVDIRLPDMAAQRRGVAVLAAAPGKVLGVRNDQPDISIRAPGAPSVVGKECGNGLTLDHGGGWQTQYCHLARGSVSVKPGDSVTAGAPLGRVGLSGDTEFPHLHFSVRRAGQAIDPFAPDMSKPTSCATQKGLWSAAARAQLAYRNGAILNAGFTDARFGMPELEAGGLRTVTAGAPLMIAYVRAIGLLPGDSIELALKNPKGADLARSRRAPFTVWRAQELYLVGVKRPAAGWPRGSYIADYTVWRAGKAVLTRRFAVTL